MARQRPDKRMSQCVGKVRFETYQLARDAAEKRHIHKRTRRRRDAYKCTYCDGFHIGTPTKKK